MSIKKPTVGETYYYVRGSNIMLATCKREAQKREWVTRTKEGEKRHVKELDFAFSTSPIGEEKPRISAAHTSDFSNFFLTLEEAKEAVIAKLEKRISEIDKLYV